jgi:hypothetical protein
MKYAALLLMALLWGGTAFAGDFSVTVRGADGKPVPDAVVMVYPNGQPTKGPIKFPWPYRVAQQNIQFTRSRTSIRSATTSIRSRRATSSRSSCTAMKRTAPPR